MQLVTVTDAHTALAQLTSDIADTIASVSGAVSSSSFSLPGTSDLANTSISLMQQLSNRADQIDVELTPYKPLDELTAPQIAELQQLQQQVISDRALVGSSISSVDWTFGGIFNDVVTTAENYASQAASGLGINWTYVAIGLGAIVLFFIYMKVK